MIDKKLTSLETGLNDDNPLSIENNLFYWNLDGSKYGRVRNDFKDKIPKIENGVILDVGCSFGWTTLEMSRIYPDSKIIGIDRFSKRIDIARNHSKNNKNVSFLVKDAYYQDFPCDSFNAIFCMNNFWYLISKKRSRVRKEFLLGLSNLVKPEGYMLFSGSDQGIIFKKNERMELWDSTVNKELFSYYPPISYLLETFNSSL